jgi:hypothetical protein
VFYTYAHYTPQGRLFYIGKGHGERAYKFHKRNNYWNNVVDKYGKPNVQILANWSTEKEAFDHEILLIECFRELGHKLVNLSNGGEGPSGVTPWNKGKKGQVAWNKGIPCKEETRLKISAFNMGKVGIKHTEEAKNKIRVASIGNTKPLKYKITGTNKATGEQIILLGTKAIKEAGFNSVLVRECAVGLRKSHKGYIWTKEILENK